MTHDDAQDDLGRLRRRRGPADQGRKTAPMAGSAGAEHSPRSEVRASLWR